MTSHKMPGPGKVNDTLKIPFSPKVYEGIVEDLKPQELIAEFEMVVSDVADDSASKRHDLGENNHRIIIARRVLLRRLNEAEEKKG